MRDEMTFNETTNAQSLDLALPLAFGMMCQRENETWYGLEFWEPGA
jgi:hypothetical protein